jgi:hypothetical protein
MKSLGKPIDTPLGQALTILPNQQFSLSNIFAALVKRTHCNNRSLWAEFETDNKTES